MAEDIERLEAAFEKGVQKLDTRIDDLSKNVTAYQINMAGRIQSIEDSANQAHKRLDASSAAWPTWIMVVIALGSLAATIIMALKGKA